MRPYWGFSAPQEAGGQATAVDWAGRPIAFWPGGFGAARPPAAVCTRTSVTYFGPLEAATTQGPYGGTHPPRLRPIAGGFSFASHQRCLIVTLRMRADVEYAAYPPAGYSHGSNGSSMRGPWRVPHVGLPWNSGCDPQLYKPSGAWGLGASGAAAHAFPGYNSYAVPAGPPPHFTGSYGGTETACPTDALLQANLEDEGVWVPPPSSPPRPARPTAGVSPLNVPAAAKKPVKKRKLGSSALECPDCPYSCAHQSDMRKHVRTHTGERPFECPECQARFSRSDNMATHIHRVHIQPKRK